MRRKMTNLIIFASFLVLVCGLPATEVESNENNEVHDETKSCPTIFSDHGMNFSSFHKGVAHGVHALSLEEIRHFFKADTPEENHIPTVNTDFRAESPVLYHAPLWGYSDRFQTWALKIMDFFMLNDRPYFYDTTANTLEKVGHQYHMHEIYREAALMYRKMVEDSSLDQQFCSCANDVLANGVLDQLLLVAKRFKYAARDVRARDWSIEICYYGVTVRFTYECSRDPGNQSTNATKKHTVRGKRSTEEELAQLKQNYLENSNKETAAALLAAGGWRPNTVTGPEKWINYSAMLTSSLPSHQMIRDFASFIYCKLNHQESKEY